MVRTSRQERSSLAMLFDPRNIPASLEPSACLEGARLLVEGLAKLGLSDKIAKIRYSNVDRGHTEPRIFLKDLTQVKLSEPSSHIGRTKLAALLYCVGRFLNVELDILSSGQVGEYDISTKHQRTHARDLQRRLDDMLGSAGAAKGADTSSSESGLTVEGIPLGAAQSAAFRGLEPRDQSEWKALARLAGKGRVISPKMFATHLERTGWTHEDVFRLNERKFRPQGLAFEIDYGSIDFRDHMTVVDTLEADIIELRERLSAAANTVTAAPTKETQDETPSASQD